MLHLIKIPSFRAIIGDSPPPPPLPNFTDYVLKGILRLNNMKNKITIPFLSNYSLIFTVQNIFGHHWMREAVYK